MTPLVSPTVSENELEDVREALDASIVDVWLAGELGKERTSRGGKSFEARSEQAVRMAAKRKRNRDGGDDAHEGSDGGRAPADAEALPVVV